MLLPALDAVSLKTAHFLLSVSPVAVVDIGGGPRLELVLLASPDVPSRFHGAFDFVYCFVSTQTHNVHANIFISAAL
jgi:hypothetical protein